MRTGRSLRARLENASPLVFSMVAVGAGFLTYFSMYGVRKPFAVGTWEGVGPFGLDLKDALILGQIFGYTISKFLGTKVCSEVLPRWRAPLLFGLVVVAELALVAAGLFEGHARIAALFVNGLPLGMVWGLVFRFLEGRRTSDLIGAGLSCSYIVASGQVKAVGQWLLNRGVPEPWMPAATGALFLVPFGVGVWLLAQLPQPAAEDVALRSERGTMNSSARTSFLRTHWVGLTPLLFLYFFLTAFRDFRDNYAKEIWAEFGRGADPSAYATPELVIAFLVLGGMATLTLVRSARRGVLAVYAMMLTGMLVLGASTFAFQRGAFSGPTWMTLVGLGLYLSYVPFGCVLFDRIVALVRSPGTAVFAIQLSDAIGYTGAVTVTLYKKLGQGELSKLAFLERFAYVTAALCGVCFVVSLFAFLRRADPESR